MSYFDDNEDRIVYGRLFGGSGARSTYQSGHDVTCKRCGATELKWRLVDDNWRLFEKERDAHNAKIMHECTQPASADEFPDLDA